MFNMKNKKIISENKKQDNVSQTSEKRIKRITPSICVTYCRYAIISNVAKSLGWKLTKENGLWNIFWTDSIQNIEIFKDMKRFQRINHFPGMSEICRKDLLARNLNRMLKLFPSDYDIFPKTWCFPADLGEAMAYSKEHKTRTFILKPDQGAQGKGISLTKNLKDIKPNERMICQVYINRPLLIDGYKFDLRIYVLLTSIDPLRIFVYNEGLVRFATNKYKEPSCQNTSDTFMHLTNYSVNKHSRTFCKDTNGGSKRKLSSLNHILLSQGFDIENLWKNIDDIIIKTILSALPILQHNYHACFPMHNIIQGCFEILGFDILIDSKLKPYILEVNHSPSFHIDENVDKDVKESLLKDTFNILNVSQIDKRKIINDDRKRVQDRLLNKNKDNNNLNSSLTTNYENSNDSRSNHSATNPISQQIDWEERHLGNYRRIMPPLNENNYYKYKKFEIVYDQSSIYSKTAASKRREEAAKQLRQEILERENKLQQFLRQSSSVKSNSNNDNGKIESKSNKIRRLRKKIHYEHLIQNKNWINGNFIIDHEERQRLLLLSQRDYLIRNSGILNIIIETFHYLDLLSESDFLKYGELFEKVQKNSNCLHNQQQQQQQNKLKNRCNIIDEIVKNQLEKIKNHEDNNRELNNSTNYCALNELINTRKILAP